MAASHRAEKRFCGGIDVGGTKLSCALFTRQGEMLVRRKMRTNPKGGEEAAEQVLRAIGSLEIAAREKGGGLLAVGICVPGIACRKGGLVWAPNIRNWDLFPLGERLRKNSRVPIFLDSDRSAYILGEQWRGAASGARHAVFLAVGTGIGAGIFIDGRVCRGSDGIAGAVGWFALQPEFKPEYASMGCFEAEASGNSLARKAARLWEGGEPSLIKELSGGRAEKATAEIVVKAARRGDPPARRLIGDAVAYISMGVANLVSMLNPEVVILGGGLMQAADLLLEPIREKFQTWAQPLAAGKVRIEISRLGEDAGLFGAGKLAWESVKNRD